MCVTFHFLCRKALSFIQFYLHIRAVAIFGRFSLPLFCNCLSLDSINKSPSGSSQGQHLHRNLSWRLEMFQFNRSQQNHFCTSMLQLFLMKVGRNASTCCQHPQFLIESVDHRLVTISRFMLTLILQTASNLRLAAIISLQYAYLDKVGVVGVGLST